ncbi:UDP-3-O-acyl-N-acetylglucosamine deacetylase [Arenibaculum pallidiluteum]|uniref:UDP-3-O-acyl-N-acetylglucosamine deacetylase n=1 Tax=Arenibaculum pallidiluteum TaxID=2812559 RepID=UPI001A96714C|nr:UDP-3-O-acyl-N-acetylglucosamine deacetylase [Arenibaculum pallidiluteum]
MTFQHTLKAAIPCTGIGLHSGARVATTLKPAAAGTGITVVRTDVPADRAVIPARWDAVVDTKLCTVIANEAGTRVGTIEHLMAALRGCGIDNAVIEVNGPEIPIMDGSAAPWVFLIGCAGIERQAEPRGVIRVLKEVTVGDGTRMARLTPGTTTSFSFDLDYSGTAVGRQQASFTLTEESFAEDIARARTFGFLHEVDHLRSIGLARGGSLDNAVVIDGQRVMNEGGLRFSNEFVRHKILDSIGDLYLAGAPIQGHFHGVRSGHQLNNDLLHALFADASAWERVEETTGGGLLQWDKRVAAACA